MKLFVLSGEKVCSKLYVPGTYKYGLKIFIVADSNVSNFEVYIGKDLSKEVYLGLLRFTLEVWVTPCT